MVKIIGGVMARGGTRPGAGRPTNWERFVREVARGEHLLLSLPPPPEPIPLSPEMQALSDAMLAEAIARYHFGPKHGGARPGAGRKRGGFNRATIARLTEPELVLRAVHNELDRRRRCRRKNAASETDRR
jgi:hypothetical protein